MLIEPIEIDFFAEAFDKSPDPASSIFFTIGLGGSAFLQPTNQRCTHKN